MKTTKEVLKSLELNEDAITKKVAKNYSNVLNFVNEIKNDVVAVEVLEYEQIISQNKRIVSSDMNEVFEVEFLRTLKISTNYGTYHFVVPINTGFYSYVCVLLKIQSNYKKEVEVVEVENTIFVDNAIIASVAKAVKFTNLKAYQDIAKNVYLRFQNDFVEVFSTTARTLYKSQKFDCISDQKIDNLVLAFSLDSVDNFKTAKNEFLKIDIIDKENVLVNDKKVSLSDVNFEPIKKFNFDVVDKMEFLKIDLQKNIKSLKPFLNYKKEVKFHLNGSIQMQPITNEPNETNISIDYLNKDFGDTDYIFSFDAITAVLMGLKSKNVLLSPKEYNGRKIALLTDNIDSFIVVSNN